MVIIESVSMLYMTLESNEAGANGKIVFTMGNRVPLSLLLLVVLVVVASAKSSRPLKQSIAADVNYSDEQISRPRTPPSNQKNTPHLPHLSSPTTTITITALDVSYIQTSLFPPFGTDSLVPYFFVLSFTAMTSSFAFLSHTPFLLIHNLQTDR